MQQEGDLGEKNSERRLRCTGVCGAYPLHRGVPRLLPELCEGVNPGPVPRRDETENRFGHQWKMFRYGGTTWALSTDERLQIVLHELGWKEQDLQGRVILDAGCGNGTLSAALVEKGATVIALDLSDSVMRARRHHQASRLLFVQGNLLFPPFRRGVFDAAYSCGVFHHTPSTQKCFHALVPLLKPESDVRYFVWLYARRSALFNATVEPIMKLTRRMPTGILGPACFAMAPFVEAASRLLNLFGADQDVSRSIRDRAIQLHDLLGPTYVWYHSYEEARQWALEAGFRDIRRISYRSADGGAESQETLLEKYRTLCRPGFGMLCRDGDPEGGS